METVPIDGREVVFRHGDICPQDVGSARRSGRIAWDIETSGLDYREAAIGTCQLHVSEDKPVIVKIEDRRPHFLCSLIEDEAIQKVFHHAMFDLRFISHHWHATPRNIACTKIASKLLDPHNQCNHSLKNILRRHLGVTIDKSQRLTDWTSAELSEEQIVYAMNDAIHLLPLLDRLEEMLASRDLLWLAHACFSHIPTRVALELRGYGDVYTY